MGEEDIDALIDRLIAGHDAQGRARFRNALRKAEAIRDSGVLEDFARLEGIEVPASEAHRTVRDDAVLVMQGFAKLSADEIAAKKEAAYDHPDGQAQLDAALKAKHYGSDAHKVWGALVEQLCGGVLSAEEAMAMTPAGGMVGPNVSVLRHFDALPAVARHAMRHDATGFLFARFGVGPGYGSKTTPLGLSSDNPLAGQILGLGREMFATSSALPSGDHVATGSRFDDSDT